MYPTENDINTFRLTHVETQYFDDHQLIAIEEFCQAVFEEETGITKARWLQKQAMVNDIMKFLEEKKFLTSKQMRAVLTIVEQAAAQSKLKFILSAYVQ